MQELLVVDAQVHHLDLEELHFAQIAPLVLSLACDYRFLSVSLLLHLVVKALNLNLIDAIVLLLGLFICLEGWDVLLWHSMRPVEGLPCEVLVEGLVHLLTELGPASEYLGQLLLVVEGVLRFVDVDYSP